jgi:hypothetical protein
VCWNEEFSFNKSIAKACVGIETKLLFRVSLFAMIIKKEK